MILLQCLKWVHFMSIDSKIKWKSKLKSKKKIQTSNRSRHHRVNLFRPQKKQLRNYLFKPALRSGVVVGFSMEFHSIFAQSLFWYYERQAATATRCIFILASVFFLFSLRMREIQIPKWFLRMCCQIRFQFQIQVQTNFNHLQFIGRVILRGFEMLFFFEFAQWSGAKINCRISLELMNEWLR